MFNHWRAALIVGFGVPGLAACDSVAPDQPSILVGTITANFRGALWISEPRPNDVVAGYDPVSGRLEVFGLRLDRWDREERLTLRICLGSGQTSQSFGDYWSPTFGAAPTPNGASGEWDLPTGEGAAGHYGSNRFRSIGLPGDSITVEMLDLAGKIVKGTFRFSARSQGGGQTFPARGSFHGRFEPLTLGC